MAAPLTSIAPAQVDALAAALREHIFGRGGMVETLPPLERQLLANTAIVVETAPDARAMQLAQSGPNDHLLGLFTAGMGGHPMIQVFASEVIHSGVSPYDVAMHELGHAFGYDHSTHPAVVALVDSGHATAACSTCGGAGGADTGSASVLRAPQEIVSQHPDSCPVCMLHDRLAVAMGLLSGLRTRAHLQHRIPLGTGGTIPLARRKVGEAAGLIAVITPMMPDRIGQLRALSMTLEEARRALTGTLDPMGVSAADDIVRRAWDSAWDINHVFWLAKMHGPAA